ncbi:MAG: hypothetical protein ACSHX5_02720 [Phycisphaerales bacterium]
MSRLVVLIGWVVLWVGSSGVVAQEELVRVGTASGVIEAVVDSAAIEGVTLRIKVEGVPDRVVLVPWYDVRSGEGDWEVPGEYVEIAKGSAIGYARRRRGDLRGCAELYRGFAERLIGSDSLMAIEVFGGLLDDAIVRQDHFDAAVAMSAIGVGGLLEIDGVDGRYRFAELVPLVDSGVDGHRLGSLAEQVIEAGGAGAMIVRAYGVIAGERDEDVVELVDQLDSMRGIDAEYRIGFELLANMLRAQEHPDAVARERTREWLIARGGARSGTWVDGWCRLAAGVSFIREADLGGDDQEQMRSRGVIQLVHVMVQRGVVDERLLSLAHELTVKGLVDGGRYDEAGEFQNNFDVLIQTMIDSQMTGNSQ